MRTAPLHRSSAGFSLVIVMFFTGVSFLMLSGILLWSSRSGIRLDRTQEYYRAALAAEAATEKVVATMGRDFHAQGITAVDAGLAGYRTLIPNELPTWSDFVFEDPGGNPSRVSVERTMSWAYGPLDWKFGGMNAWRSTYRLVSDARSTAARNNIEAGVVQEVQLASIPVVSFQGFYNQDFEFHPALSVFNMSGKVHANGTVYCNPLVATLNFNDSVTATGGILKTNAPGDDTIAIMGEVSYRSHRRTRVPALTLPIGTNDGSYIVDLPSVGESGTFMSQQRIYSQASLLIQVADGGSITSPLVVVTNGPARPPSVIPEGIWKHFVTVYTNAGGEFLDKRQESRWVYLTEFDLGGLLSRLPAIRGILGEGGVQVVHITDLRRFGGGTLTGVRVKNGASLPSGGLTIATPNPLYVWGDYNTINPKPALLAGDAVSVLSSAWLDANSTASFRGASDTTVNAGIVTGIAPTTPAGDLSGGYLNSIRLLEHWGGRSLRVNGSIAVLFNSRFADTPWRTSDGWSALWAGAYGTPTVREFVFDPSFLTQAGIPHACPRVQVVLRTRYDTIAPGATM